MGARRPARCTLRPNGCSSSQQVAPASGGRGSALSMTQHEPTVALLPWGNVLEDFIDTIGVSLETFCNEFTGSYMFGYVDALRRAGVLTVLICIFAPVVMS